MDGNALHVAAASGFADIVSLLVVAGASKTARNSHGERPIDIATRLGYRDIAFLLGGCCGRRETEL